MCRVGITIAPRGEMIMKSRMTVNCRNPRIPITTFWYPENWIRVGLLVAVLSMGGDYIHGRSHGWGGRARSVLIRTQRLRQDESGDHPSSKATGETLPNYHLRVLNLGAIRN